MRKAILHLKKKDAVLRRIIEQVGPYRIEFLEPEFETLVKAIVAQQLSGKAALTIFNRLKEAHGNGDVTPNALLQLSPDKLRELGLSRQKIAYIRDLAERTLSGEIDFPALTELPDEEVMHHLTRVKGIGVWTAHMFLIFALRRMNVLPTGDLGIRVAMQKAYGLPQIPTPAEIESIALDWHPYCTVASWYLWRSVEPNANL